MNRLLSSCLALAALALASAASADVAPPKPAPECSDPSRLDPCKGKKVGDACAVSSGASGSCAALRCTNDAGEALLACAASGAQPTKTPDDDGCAIGARGAAGSGAIVAIALVGAALRGRRRRR
ncbi:MAG: hypothetical protein JNL38_33335 [Myxococcales bacterium]|nr:hypothetical protein [Myxococcales bacterium]